MAAPTPVRKYPYEVVDGFIKIAPSQLEAIDHETEWKITNMRDLVKEYMRRATSERGEDDSVQLHSANSVQLRVDMHGCCPEQAQAVFEKLQDMGLDVRLFNTPATVPSIHNPMLDEEEEEEEGQEEEDDAAGDVVKKEE